MKLIVNLYSRGLFLLVALLLCNLSFAQRTITGTVTDADNGEPLIGANILISGTAQGTVTDFDGKFNLEVPADATSLEFSYTGYQSQTITLTASNIVDVALASGELLDEVVVIGYGSVKKDDATGSVLAVSDEDFNKGAIVSANNLITGKVAGVQVTPSSQPGEGGSFRIRGGTTTGNNEPLIVIDGVPIGNGANLAFYVSPSDIETFTVLKDASATAIYGARGANGVIIITTKRGEKGAKPRFTYNGFASFANEVEALPILSAAEFRNVVTFKAPNRIGDLGPERTDWFDEVTRETAFGQGHDLSVSGGSENFTYRVSANYQNIEGIVKPFERERIGFGLALDLTLADGQFNIATNIKGNFNNSRSDVGAIGGAWVFDPTQPVFDINNTTFGGYFEYGVGLTPRNPVSSIEQQLGEFEEFGSIGNVEFEYKPSFFPGFTAKVNMGYDIFNNTNRFFRPTTFSNLLVDDRNGNVDITDRNGVNLLLDAYINYKTDIGANSTIDFTAGYSYQDEDEVGNFINAFNFASDAFGFNSLQEAEDFQASAFVSTDYRLVGFFGRLNYSLMDRYLFTVSVRRDGSSRFGPDNRWGTFPSAAFGWRILQEPFAAGLANTFSDLKLRVGYGVTGNQEIGNDFGFLPTYRPSDLRARYLFGDRFISTLRPNAYDAGLKWEETRNFNIGLDFGFSNGRISGIIEYYNKQTEDLLFFTNIPSGTNLSDRILTNIGALENEGVELTLNAAVISKPDFTWDVSLNAAYNRNEVLAVDGSETGVLSGPNISVGVGSQVQIIQVGSPLNAFYLRQHIYDENGNPLNDDGRSDIDIYEDLNGDGTINEDDFSVSEQPAPDVLLGFTSNLYYKNFDLSFTLRGNIGNFVYNDNAVRGHFQALEGANNLNNLHTSVLLTNFDNPQQFSDYYLEDASFLRLDNITLGYNVPNMPSGVNLRFYGTAENLFVITEYSGLDPEVGNGIDNNVYPRQRRLVFGASLGF